VDWLHPFASIDAGIGPSQLAQSLFAFAAGGITGTGLGLGHSVLIGFAAKSDFILATAGEELGLLGLSAIFLLYALIVARGIGTGIVLRDPFGRLLAVGLASLLALQVFVIAGGVMGLIPLTGMAMPFLAQGGSSVVTNWVIVALLLRISDSARRPRPAGAADRPVADDDPSPRTPLLRLTLVGLAPDSAPGGAPKSPPLAKPASLARPTPLAKPASPTNPKPASAEAALEPAPPVSGGGGLRRLTRPWWRGRAAAEPPADRAGESAGPRGPRETGPAPEGGR
jgi:hypothetical protein